MSLSFLRVLALLRVFLLITCVASVLSACESGVAKDEPYYHLVESESLVLHQGYAASRHFAGTVEAKSTVDLAFELPGTVLSVLVDEGDKVLAGQELMRLDTRLLEEEHKHLLALQDEVVARQSLVALQIRRQQQLQQKGLAAQQKLDELGAQAAVLKAQFNQQRSRLLSVAVRISKSVIKAPYAAHISARHFDAGAVVNPSQPVLQLLEQGSLEARVGVPAKLAAHLKHYLPNAENASAKQSSTVVVSLADQSKANAKILAIGESINPLTRTVSVRLALPSSLHAVSGDLIFLQVDEHYDDVGFWVPLEALSAGLRGTWNVLALIQSEQNAIYQLQTRSVELLHRGDNRVFVQGGLMEGEQFVASGLHRLVAGQLVRVQAKAVVINTKDERSQ